VISPRSDGIRALVVDDEVPARQRLIDLLRHDSQVTAVLEAGDGQSAIEMIHSAEPELIFLDVQMPELDGLSVIEAVGAAQMPLTVFVTAYDQHAVRAFEANALDYLLKPFSDERFESTMARAKTRLDERSLREFAAGVLRMMPASPSPDRHLDRLVVKSAGITRFVRVSDIPSKMFLQF
jgi:two-component system LytT family response regulator